MRRLSSSRFKFSTMSMQVWGVFVTLCIRIQFWVSGVSLAGRSRKSFEALCHSELPVRIALPSITNVKAVLLSADR